MGKYKNVGPPSKLSGAQEKAIFTDPDPENQLYQYILDDTWYFYNDGQTQEAHVEYTFGPNSKISALGKTKMEKVSDGFHCTLVVQPGQTEPFIKGTPNGYKSSYSTKSLEPEPVYLPQSAFTYKNVGPSSSLKNAKGHAIFEGTGTENQLYHFISDNVWYFYNDGHTQEAHVDYVFGPRSTISALGNTKLEKVSDGIKCTLVVQPGKTEPFISGTVNGYKSSYATKTASKK